MKFDKEKLKQYEIEAKDRFGNTDAWREYEDKAAHRDSKDFADAAEGIMRIFAKLEELKDQPPESSFVQTEISNLQKYITDNYYTCTDEIFAGLGEAYRSDSRFKKNIDRVGGDGTAEFVSEAIKVHCKNQ
ncbi:MAG: TipAS antibiotic-recognition domain-containing protein [Clostridia bacterium]|nr:TipAS antibiotic-recognition domain-containing protein [Clostridia bacterium]